MRKHLLAAAASIILSLVLGVGIAVAVDGGPKHASQAPAASSDESTGSESVESDETESDATESEGTESESADNTAGEHPENHGKYVSEAAQSCPPGPEHGACVSAVAHSDQGKKGK